MRRDEIIMLLGENWPEVRRLIQQYIHSDVALLNRTNEAVLENSGKMLRPMVSLLTAGAISEINDDSRLVAAFAEVLHNATLMHDDVTDESRTRRGRPSVMSLLGPSAAVLLGDFWLARSMEIMNDIQCRSQISKFFTRTITDLAEGEMLQLEKSMSLDLQESDYYRIIYGKTASLFRSSCMAAAAAAGAGPAQLEAASEYGRCLGIAFQIKDDILDYDGSSSMGKPTGVDIREQKITLPLLGAFSNAPQRRDEITGLLSKVRENPENAELISHFVAENGGVEYAAVRLDEFVQRAVSALSILQDTEYRQALESIAEYNSYRQK